MRHDIEIARGVKTFKRIAGELQQLTAAAELALHLCAQQAVKGVHENGEHLENCLALLREAQLGLAKAFRQKLSGAFAAPSEQTFSAKDLPQLALASSLSGYTQKVQIFVSSQCSFEMPRQRGPCWGLLKGFMSMFPSSSLLHSWTFTRENGKLFLTFLTCFAVGRSGIGSGVGGTPIIPGWNATPAGTVAYLIFQKGNQAAALKKNLDRFVGVGLGTMLGQLTLNVSCDLEGDIGASDASTKALRILKDIKRKPSKSLLGGHELDCLLFLLAYFCLEYLSFFVYFASANFSYAGLMFSCFFAEHSLHSCSVQGRSLSNYENLLSQLVAIIVASLMDLLTDDSMSIRATEALERFLEALAEALEAFPLSRRDDARRFASGK